MLNNKCSKNLLSVDSRFMDYFEGEEQSVLLAEYLQGGELFQRISSKDYELTEAKCRDFFRQILKGVEYIHSKKDPAPRS